MAQLVVVESVVVHSVRYAVPETTTESDFVEVYRPVALNEGPRRWEKTIRYLESMSTVNQAHAVSTVVDWPLERVVGHRDREAWAVVARAVRHWEMTVELDSHLQNPWIVLLEENLRKKNGPGDSRRHEEGPHFPNPN
jgi:hypothetical protein